MTQPTQLHLWTTTLTLGLAACGFLLTASPAAAQDAGQSEQAKLKEKVREINRLMKQAEEGLVRSLSSAGKSKATQDAIDALLDQKAQSAAGKSAAELRKLAEEGSEEASKTIQKLIKESTQEVSKMASGEIKKLLEKAGKSSGSAGEGIRKILEGSKKSGEGVSKGIEWVLENATKKQSAKPKKKKPSPKKPPDKTEEPKDPKDNERWVAQLPDQIRKAYESKDWDSIPPKWRRLIRAWTKKMATDLEKDR